MLFFPFFRLTKRSPTTISSPPKHPANQQNLDDISEVERNDRPLSRSSNVVIVSKQKEVRWNQQTISPQEQFINKTASCDTTISPIISQQCEIKVSSISKFGNDNITTTDTTGSYRSSMSNIDVSSPSLRDKGMYIKRNTINVN